METVELKMHLPECSSCGCKFEKKRKKMREKLSSTSDETHIKDMLKKRVCLLLSLTFTGVTLLHLLLFFSWFGVMENLLRDRFG